MSKTILIIAIIAVLSAGGWFFLSDSGDDILDNLGAGAGEVEIENEEDESMDDGEMDDTEETSVTPPSVPQVPPPSSGTPTGSTATKKTHEVTYSDTGYSPASLEIALGDTVTFINNSTHGMWTASAMHPTHAVYPEKSPANCLGSSFDQCVSGKAGERWSFTFNTVGTWKYHNHVNASKFGQVIVK